jgi:hypothetical protein
MKKLLAIILTTGTLYSAAHGQGLVNFVNSAAAASKISINSVPGGAATGLTPPGAGSFYYAAFFSVSATTVDGSSGPVIPTLANNGNYAWNDVNWTFTGDYATNTTLSGRLLGNNSATSSGALVSGLAGGAFAKFVVIGWSSNLGSTVASAETALQFGNFVGTGYIGESAVSGSVQVGDGVTVPNPSLLAASGAVPGFTLGVIPVPEPGTMALAGLGGLSLLVFRRRI